MPCECPAYPFPHRAGGGGCYIGKHCTFGDSMQDVLLALMQEFGVRSSNACNHVLDVDESCVGCYRLARQPVKIERLAQNLGAGLAAANKSLAEISPGTRLVVSVQAGHEAERKH